MLKVLSIVKPLQGGPGTDEKINTENPRGQTHTKSTLLRTHFSAAIPHCGTRAVRQVGRCRRRPWAAPPLSPLLRWLRRRLRAPTTPPATHGRRAARFAAPAGDGTRRGVAAAPTRTGQGLGGRRWPLRAARTAGRANIQSQAAAFLLRCAPQTGAHQGPKSPESHNNHDYVKSKKCSEEIGKIELLKIVTYIIHQQGSHIPRFKIESGFNLKISRLNFIIILVSKYLNSYSKHGYRSQPVTN